MDKFQSLFDKDDVCIKSAVGIFFSSIIFVFFMLLNKFRDWNWFGTQKSIDRNKFALFFIHILLILII